MVRRGESVKQYVNRMIEEMVRDPLSTEVPPMNGITPEFIEKRINLLPYTLRQRGRILMHHLKQNNFAFSSQGEFIPSGCTEPIPGSYIDQLLLFTLRRPHHWRIGPVGFSDFLMQLEYSNIPRGLISNRHYPNYVWNKDYKTGTRTEKVNQSDFNCQP